MPAKGYCTLQDAERVLGQELTSTQAKHALVLLEAAEQWIDRYQGRAYAVATITDELHVVEAGFVRLNSRPVTAITSVSASAYPAIAPESTVLVAAETYRLLYPLDGLLYVGRSYDGYLLTVSYAASSTVPANVRMATAELLAHWLRPITDGITADVASYTVPGEISVTYAGADAGGGTRRDIPGTVYELLGRRLVIV